MSRPLIAVEPHSDGGPARTWVVDAVEAGGGELSDPDRAEGLVWMAPWKTDGLAEVLARGPRIRWVQLPLAGVEQFAGTGLFSDGRVWTCAKGVYADQVAEHALALALAGMRSVVASARARTWLPPSGRVLHERHVCIVGGGGITRSLLNLLAPFRTDNVVVRQRAEPVPGAGRVVGPDGLIEALGQADLVVLALALTPQTEGLIGAEQLEAMRSHAWLVNVARGRHVRTDQLVDALRGGAIGGAALDVTDPEPLPDAHPLWELPNCVVTPHIANTPAMSVGPLSKRIQENVDRFGRGDQLLGLIDPSLGY